MKKKKQSETAIAAVAEPKRGRTAHREKPQVKDAEQLKSTSSGRIPRRHP